MKNQFSKQYLYWGATILGVIACSALLFVLLFRTSQITTMLGQVITIFKPFIYGLVMAYLLTPIFNYCYQKIHPIFKKRMKNPAKAHKLAKTLSTTASVLLMLFVIAVLLWMVIPQLITSLTGLVNSLPANLNKLSDWIQQKLDNNPALETYLVQFSQNAGTNLTKWFQTQMLPHLNQQVGPIFDGVKGTFTVLKDLLVGLFVCMYVLNSKELFAAQSKKVIYSLCDVKKGNRIIDTLRFANRIFGGFIGGKLLDSFIIGMMCFVTMAVLGLPYPVLISVIIGVTNIIPFFGPFIGAIPSTLFILINSPVDSLKFLVVIVIIQQIDGNIIGPKILGDSTGLSSFWVMFSILAFGGFFGFTGMLIGVPLFAVIYSLLSEFIKYILQKRKLPEDTKEYFYLHHMSENRTPMYSEHTEE